MDEGTNNCGEIFVHVTASLLENVNSIKVNGELARKKHKEEQEVQDEEWLVILLFCKDLHDSLHKCYLLHLFLHMFLDLEDLTDNVRISSSELFNCRMS